MSPYPPSGAPLRRQCASAAADAGPPATSRDDFISIEGVSKIFTGRNATVQALDMVDLTVADGEFVSIIGPSGCGKTTLSMLIAGLELPTTGTIRVGGKWIDVLQAQIRKQNMVEARERARQLLAMVGLESFASAYPHELSGGMRQRVSICRALLHNPPLLLMDEPFGALDALTRDQLNIDLLRIWSDRQMTVVFVTHSIPEAVFLSDRVVVMSPRPGHIEKIIAIDLPRPRRLSMRQTLEFTRYNQIVTDMFKSLGVLREEEA
jgi:NitT/TauT family transport system ATP-binding protein